MAEGLRRPRSSRPTSHEDTVLRPMEIHNSKPDEYDLMRNSKAASVQLDVHATQEPIVTGHTTLVMSGPPELAASKSSLCPLVWSPQSGLGQGPTPSYHHMGILLNIPDQSNQTRVIQCSKKATSREPGHPKKA